MVGEKRNGQHDPYGCKECVWNQLFPSNHDLAPALIFEEVAASRTDDVAFVI
jgi:hypothetical protein